MITMTEKEPQGNKIIGFKLPKEFLWKNKMSGIASYWKRPSRKVFWYNFSTLIMLMLFSGYLIGKIQNDVNHHDLMKRGVSELEEYTTTRNSMTN